MLEENNYIKGISKEKSVVFKGIACLMIIIHHYVHLAETHNNNFLVYLISAHFGYIFVSLFFLLSGYGLAESETGVNRRKFPQFLKRRLVSVYYPFVIVNIFTIVLYYFINKEKFNIVNIYEYTFGIRLIDPMLWYVNVLLLFYLLFWISFYFKKTFYKVISLLILAVTYIVFAHFYFRLPSNLYVSVLSFPLGVCCSLYKKQIYTFLNYTFFYLYYLLYIIFLITLFFVFHRLGWQVLKTVSISFLFVPLYLYLSKLNLDKYKILLFIGNISYEIYLVHFKVFVIMGLFFFDYKSLWLFMIIVIVIAYVFNQILSFKKVSLPAKLNIK